MNELPGRSRAGHVAVSAVAVAVSIAASACSKADTSRTAGDSTATAHGAAAAQTSCTTDPGGITLPAGFCATVFADSLGHPRHIVVAQNGDVYINTWSGAYYTDKARADRAFLVALRDTNHDGRADVVQRFGPTAAQGGRGGTGIGLHDGALYAEESATIVKYALASNTLVPAGAAMTIVNGLPLKGDHPMHPFVIDSEGDMYVDMGSASNSCQAKNRTLQSPGVKPCVELETRGGIWRYDANKTNQAFSPAERYATGIRNAVGIALSPSGQLFSTQHGRDQLAENWPKLYKPDQGQNLPAEELLEIEKGADYGWPTCYFDNAQQKLVLAPEFGGDGGTAVGECAQKKAPAAFFPAHWAPDGLVFYSGSQFPEHYRGGAFIAFHGSWNRAPGPQGGYQVVFVPFANGKATAQPGQFEKFADDFAAGKLQPDQAVHRPTGLAQGPDGSLYITDDKGGRVWRVTFGNAPH